MMLSELLLNDLIAVERKLERLADDRRKGGTDRTHNERQSALFQRLHDALNAGTPLREMPLGPEDVKELAAFALLTQKPVLIVFNTGEGPAPPPVASNIQSVAVQGKLEMEIAQLPPEDAAAFMKEYAIEELSLDRMIRLSYDLLRLHSFFTVGEDEVRAWTLRRGATALDAAGEVHTDLQRGFVRAEVVPYSDLVALGSMQEAKAKGKLRLEGKEYVVADGDIVHIRFNV
jgi:ribosome-binding ATPase YchF (GTP1/OBG family)